MNEEEKGQGRVWFGENKVSFGLC